MHIWWNPAFRQNFGFSFSGRKKKGKRYIQILQKLLTLGRFNGPTNVRHPDTTCFLAVLFYVCYSCEPAGGDCCCPSGRMAHVQDSSLIGFTGSKSCQLTRHLLHTKAPRSATCCIVVYEENAFWAMWGLLATAPSCHWRRASVATWSCHVASLVFRFSCSTHTHTDVTHSTCTSYQLYWQPHLMFSLTLFLFFSICCSK